MGSHHTEAPRGSQCPVFAPLCPLPRVLGWQNEGYSKAHDDLRCAGEGLEPRFLGKLLKWLKMCWRWVTTPDEHSMKANWRERFRKLVRNKVAANSFYKEGCWCGENQIYLAKKCKLRFVFSVVSQCSECPRSMKHSFLQIPKWAIKCSTGFQSILGNPTFDPF